MTILSVIGLVILVIGVFLIGFGFRGTQTITNKVVEGVTGHYTQRTKWYLIGGALLIIVGGVLLLLGGHDPVGVHPPFVEHQ